VTVVTSAGLPGYDGIHYAVAGHLQVARELFPLVAQRFYGSIDTLQIRFPNVRKVFFADSTRRLVSLLFEESQRMVWPRDTLFNSQANGGGTVQSLKNYFLLDKQTVRVDSGWAEGNRVWLRLAQPAAPGRLQYLPASWDNVHMLAFAGPVLKNERGRRAAGFTVALQPALSPVPNLMASADSLRLLRLRWNAVVGARRYDLERAPTPTGPFQTLARVEAGTTSYTDRRLPDSTQFWYRIRALSDSSESPYRLTNARTLVAVRPVADMRPLVVTATEPPAADIRVFPNPAKERVTVQWPIAQPATVRLLDLSGQALREARSNTTELTLALTGLRGGLYLLWIQTERQMVVRKLVVE
ncbi:MAG: T9SS type A sorting domain-containing protein, partial [Sphingobacteriaceae bacterium]|nr:T9SS type A sorting domain-containing protein [Cytophagaceae bacterium]